MISDETIKQITSALQVRDTSRLNEEHQRLLEFFSFADDAIRTYGTGKCVPVIMEKFNCSRSAAYEYIKGAQWVFGSTFLFEKNYHKSILLEQYDQLILAGLRTCIGEVEEEDEKTGEKTKSIKVIDTKTFAFLMKYMEGKERILKLHEEDPPFDPKELHKLPILTARPEDLGIERKELSEEVIKIIEKHGGRRLLTQ